MQNALNELKKKVALFSDTPEISDEELLHFAENTVVALMAGGCKQ